MHSKNVQKNKMPLLVELLQAKGLDAAHLQLKNTIYTRNAHGSLSQFRYRRVSRSQEFVEISPVFRGLYLERRATLCTTLQTIVGFDGCAGP